MRIERLLRRLHREGWLGWSHLRIWKQLASCFAADGNVGRHAPSFFTLTATAHLDAAVLHASRLLDTHKDAAGVDYLLNLAERASDRFPHAGRRKVLAAVKQDRMTLGCLQTMGAALKARRDRVLAHLDRKVLTNPQTIPALNARLIADIEAIYSSLSEIVNRYEGFWSDSEELWELIGWDDFRRLARLAEAGTDPQVRRYMARRRRGLVKGGSGPHGLDVVAGGAVDRDAQD